MTITLTYDLVNTPSVREAIQSLQDDGFYDWLKDKAFEEHNENDMG